jgi:hypothetical protein
LDVFFFPCLLPSAFCLLPSACPLHFCLASETALWSGSRMLSKTALIPLALRRRFFSLFMGMTAALAAGSLAQTAQGQRLGISGPDEAAAARWQRLTNQPPFLTDTALLLTDGTVMVHEYGATRWWRLTPDINGSYLNGTWSQLASMQPDYAPLYFASAVLADGRVIVEGGEYNFLQFAETNKGSIYNPTTNIWTQVNPPAGWSSMGDSPGIVLNDGTFMLGRPTLTPKKALPSCRAAQC